jgi:hypothetical protein
MAWQAVAEPQRDSALKVAATILVLNFMHFAREFALKSDPAEFVTLSWSQTCRARGTSRVGRIAAVPDDREREPSVVFY